MNKKTKFSNFYIWFILLILYIPIVLVVIYSFNVSEKSIVWNGFTLDWYVEMINDKGLMRSVWVSIRVALMTTLLSAVIGTLGAVGIKNLSNKLRTVVSGLSNSPLVIPEVIMGVALLMFISASPIPSGIPALVVGHSIFCIPYIMIMVNIRLDAIEPEIIEAARDLGASNFKVFTTITLPLIAPGIATGSLLAVAMSMDDVIISFFLSSPQSTTMPVKIYSMLKLGITPKINALCTLILLATFTVIGIAQLSTLKKDK